LSHCASPKTPPRLSPLLRLHNKKGATGASPWRYPRCALNFQSYSRPVTTSQVSRPAYHGTAVRRFCVGNKVYLRRSLCQQKWVAFLSLDTFYRGSCARAIRIIATDLSQAVCRVYTRRSSLLRAGLQNLVQPDSSPRRHTCPTLSHDHHPC
jgi:hypothetical protein